VNGIDLTQFSNPGFWLVAAIVLGVIEAFTAGLVTIWLVFGALAAWVAAILGLSFVFQLIIFLIVSYIMLITTRPIVKKWLSREIVKTNADRLIGQIGYVTEKINRLEGVGQVKVAGQIWSAVPAAGNEIEPGTKVRIDEIAGVKLVVTQIDT
jgi:membrane protein implicated in regulation of membrane protease activity